MIWALLAAGMTTFIVRMQTKNVGWRNEKMHDQTLVRMAHPSA
ncbi:MULTISPECIES: hypothetical protein [unclassified Stappia]|nr:MULTISPECIES: hypothetical protein [unclassified Stappia]